MELFLNFIWLSVSLALIVTWVKAVRRGDTKCSWTVFLALVLLVVLLLPVISMTDDLVAMANPTELEHTVRRSDLSLAQSIQDIAALLDVGMLAILLFISFTALFSRLSRFTLRMCPRKTMLGFVRTAGVRPPPSALTA